MHILDFVPKNLRQVMQLMLLSYTMMQVRVVYFPKLTCQKIHECLLYVDEEHCGNPLVDWLTLPTDPATLITLTEKQKVDMLHRYAKLDEAITPKEDCLIGLGYNNCIDINFRAVELFEAISEEITTLQESRSTKLVPQVHPEIATLDAFIETFLYFFSQGSNAEFTSLNKDLFFLFMERLTEAKIPHVTEIGGHSSVWALRS